MNHRFDKRTKKEFKKQISERTLQERELFFYWLDLLEKDLGHRPSFEETGCDNSGEFIEDAEVSTDADFLVEGIGLVEVKFSKPLLDKFFHLKVGQVKSYIRQNASILMVNGADEEIPQWTILSPEKLQEIVDTCEVVSWFGFGGKKSFRIQIGEFIWRNLK